MATALPLWSDDLWFWMCYNVFVVVLGYILGPLHFGSDDEIMSRGLQKWEQGNYTSADEEKDGAGDGGEKRETKSAQKKRLNNIHDRADIIASLLTFPLIIYYVCMDFFFTEGRGASEEDRVFGTSYFAVQYCYLYIARQIVSCVFMFTGDCLNVRDVILMTVHHLVSIVAYAGSLGTGRLSYYATFDGVCEITTFHLTFLLYVRTKGVSGAWYAQLNAFCLWAGFIVFRLVLFPCWLYAFYLDCWAGDASTSLCIAEATVAERVFYPAVTILLLAMSAFWFVPISKGFVKTVFPPKEEGETKKTK